MPCDRMLRAASFLHFHTWGALVGNEEQEERDAAGIATHRPLSKVAYDRLGNDASPRSGFLFFVCGGRHSPILFTSRRMMTTCLS